MNGNGNGNGSGAWLLKAVVVAMATLIFGIGGYLIAGIYSRIDRMEQHIQWNDRRLDRLTPDEHHRRMPEPFDPQER